MGGFLTLVEPVVIINTVGSCFYDTALDLSVYKRALELAEGQSDQAQALASHFLLLHNCLVSLLSFISTTFLGWLADRCGPRVLLVLPQIGSVASKSLLLAFVLLRLPLAVLYAGAAVHGLLGGSAAYWGGVFSQAALSSGQERRSLKLSTVDFCSGVAGVVGGLLSGFLYQVGQSGVALIATSALLCVGGLLYSAFLLSYPRPSSGEGVSQSAQSQQEPVWTDWRGVALVFAAMALFDLGMSGAEDVLCLYVQKPPLSWDSIWLGYGSAATNGMYVTSFLGVLVLSRPLGDKGLILLGIVSNCTGMAIMAFATQNWVYFFARGIMMFACIPMPTIRSQLSKTLDAQLYVT
ncbi:hypothetical protein SKAU_G00053540 [Synaphobranchus kaupii]|uniref:Uncharacterized protein n=1 Tax=Synaphobranchus kaupii TaxID=118154 RepID=A0A9Q1J7U3_SYNKA|nr:hypothetical protein SKAU_G00053540 [Synaphobranchus kaupii]